MFQVIRDLKATMTPEEFRNEMIGSAAFLVLFPIFFTLLWVITPA